MAKSLETRIPEDTTWADYCDALQAERWSRLLEAQRLNRSRQHRPAVADLHQSESARKDPRETSAPEER